MLFFSKKVLTSVNLRGPWYQKIYFLKLHICVYLRAKFQVSTIILTSIRQGVILPPTTSEQTPKKSTQIRVQLPDD